ncbi:HupE/UreJ family protein [Oceaniserpentilla sp. 4NH20-0058]|uniref:HupE/UreJ family protein n=1 Tax=Oceaniserpentilla sp. 4NH20-0058 TaxID=3127660 RepID=UPI003106AA0E
MKKLLLASLSFMPALALAHAGHESVSANQGFIAGMLHPIMGLDHLFAIAALGLLLYKASAKQSILIGIGFISLMALGFYSTQSGLFNLAVETVEGLILLSVGLSAAFLVFNRFINIHAGLIALLGFAVFHGMAHGAEVSSAVSAHSFALGFVLTCAMIMGLMRFIPRSVFVLSAKRTARV